MRAQFIQIDEIWSYVGCKQAHLTPGEESERGDAYTFVAMDDQTKFVPSYLVGKRNWSSTDTFVSDLRARVAGAPQISSDQWVAYRDAVERAFGTECSYGQVVKHYNNGSTALPAARRYSPSKLASVEVLRVAGEPNEEMICTSHVERGNLTMRTFMKRFQRLTLGFSKKLANLEAAVHLHFAYYNLCWQHSTIRTSPAQAAGVSNHLWSVAELVDAALATEEDVRAAA